MKTISLILLLTLFFSTVTPQQQPQTDSNTPLHRLQPDYPVPYGAIKAEEIATVLKRVHAYLDQVTTVLRHLKTVSGSTCSVPRNCRQTLSRSYRMHSR